MDRSDAPIFRLDRHTGPPIRWVCEPTHTGNWTVTEQQWVDESGIGWDVVGVYEAERVGFENVPRECLATRD